MNSLVKTAVIALCLFIVVFTACKKGDTGPIGPQGEQGIKGDNGNTILSGKGAPSASVGSVGDFYIDLNANALYGPKTSSGWGSALNLKGAAGANGSTGDAGKNGSTILSGAGTPAANLGVVGDYYFDKTNSLFYGPKTSSGWGGGLSLKGRDGNANVFSITFPIVNVTWTPVAEYSTNYKVADLNVPQITSDIVANGGIFVYAEMNFLGQTWTALPLSWLEMGVTHYFFFGVKAGSIRLRFSQSDNVLPSSPNIPIRVVYMTGKAVTADVNFNDYNAVKKAFHLDD